MEQALGIHNSSVQFSSLRGEVGDEPVIAAAGRFEGLLANRPELEFEIMHLEGIGVLTFW